jgi:hypothetical protein
LPRTKLFALPAETAEGKQLVTVRVFAPVSTILPAPSISVLTDALEVFTGSFETPVDGTTAASPGPGTPDELQFAGSFQLLLTFPVQTRGFVKHIVTSWSVGVTDESLVVRYALYFK